MSNIKYAPMEPLSGWLEYRLVGDKLDPPVFRCRLRPITDLNLMDGVDVGDEKFKAGRTAQDLSIEAVAEWDLTVNGAPVPLTPETKVRYLLPIIAEQVEGRPLGILLGVAIVQDARKAETFLKN
jgi:hypothetical protein